MSESNSTRNALLKRFAGWSAPASLRYMSRTVRRRPGRASFGGWGMRLFILPHMTIGAISIVILLAYPIWAIGGRDIPAKIVSLETGIGSTKNKTYTTYEVHFDYAENGVTTGKKERISKEYFDELTRRKAASADKTYGQGVVRSLTVGGRGYRSLLDPHQSLATPMLGILAWTTIWNGLLSVFVWHLYVVPVRQRRLYRNGVPAPGVITEKDAFGNKGRRYILKYSYLSSPGHVVGGKMDCANTAYGEANVGELVTVLHYAGREKPSVIYEYGNYSCESDA